jgi:hypothetical protein
MRPNVKILVLLLVSIALYARAEQTALPSGEQLDKLVSAAWKDAVNSIDVTSYKHITKPAMSEEEIWQMVEDFFNKAEGPKENLSGSQLEERNRTIQMNVERTIKEQQIGRRMKERVRIHKQRQRIDQVIGYPKMVLLEGTPHEKTEPAVELTPNTPYETSFVNSIDKNTGDLISFTYYHTSKKAQVTSNQESRWNRSDVIEFAQLATFFQALLGVNKGSISDPVFVPDRDKIEQLRKTGLVAGRLRLTIKPDADNPDARDYIQLKSDDCPCGTVFVCERVDYSRVYYTEVCNPITGQPLYITKCSNFDDQGFPRNATTIEYDLDGKLKKKKVYTILEVNLNPSIPDEVFEFDPPEGYEVTDLRPKKPQATESN